MFVYVPCARKLMRAVCDGPEGNSEYPYAVTQRSVGESHKFCSQDATTFFEQATEVT